MAFWVHSFKHRCEKERVALTQCILLGYEPHFAFVDIMRPGYWAYVIDSDKPGSDWAGMIVAPTRGELALKVMQEVNRGG